ncbi:MAG: hypothetical protein LUC33_01550, partial [Prevotellaceae bacterium]|nr:hypothetical protein [Prevotellaceae bacterium]
MKKIRIKKDMTCTLAITAGGVSVNVEGRAVTVLLVRPDHTRVNLKPLTLVDDTVTFLIPHRVQNDLGVYGLEVWLDKDTDAQTVVDLEKVFALVPLTSMEETDDDDTLSVMTLEMEAAFQGLSIIDSLDSYLTDAALSANQGRVLDAKISSLKSSMSESNAELEQTVSDAVDTVTQAVATEQKAREDADATLQQAVDNEATARQDADATLQQAVDNEATART